MPPTQLAELDLFADVERPPASLYLELARAQRLAHEADLGVLVIVEGWNYSGKAEVVQFITERMDPRWFKVHTWLTPTGLELEQPSARRYMEHTPRRGEMVFFVRSWYSEELERRVRKEPGPRLRWRDIRALEESLIQDNTLVVRIWLHLSREELARRRREPRDPQWSPLGDSHQCKSYPRYLKLAEKMISATQSDQPWTLLAATRLRDAKVAAAKALVAAIDQALENRPGEDAGAEIAGEPACLPVACRLAALDLTQDLPAESYQTELRLLQARLARAQHRAVENGKPVILVFEGWDAAGKGGAIRRLRSVLNPCFYEVHSIGPPQGEERVRHYLWRFWKRLPSGGQWGIFDRSWYGRVLVERIEGFATVPEWKRAYQEIYHFEDQLLRAGATLCKFWLHLSEEEQLRRFEERMIVEHKRYKMSQEDWRNRAKRDAYLEAAEEMFERTHRPEAPWFLIAAESKRLARIEVLQKTVQAVEAAHPEKPTN